MKKLVPLVFLGLSVLIYFELRQDAAPTPPPRRIVKSVPIVSPPRPLTTVEVRQNAAPAASPAAALGAVPIVHLPHPGVLGGTITRSGACTPTSQINVCATAKSARICQVSDDGRFSLSVAPGRYKVLAVCEQLIAESIGLLDVQAGEHLEGLVLELKPQSTIGLQLLLPDGVADEALDIVSDPASHDWRHMDEHHAPGGALDFPLGPYPLGDVALTAHGRCLDGEVKVTLKEPNVLMRARMQLKPHPCEEEKN